MSKPAFLLQLLLSGVIFISCIGAQRDGHLVTLPRLLFASGPLHLLLSQASEPEPPSPHIGRHTYLILTPSQLFPSRVTAFPLLGYPDFIQRDCHSIMSLFFQHNTLLLFVCYCFKVNISSIKAATLFLLFIVFLAAMTIEYT